MMNAEADQRRWRRNGFLLLIPTIVFGAGACVTAAMDEESTAKVCMALAFANGVFSVMFFLGSRIKPGDEFDV